MRQDDVLVTGAMWMALSVAAGQMPTIRSVEVEHDDGMATNVIRVVTQELGAIRVTVEAVTEEEAG